MKLVLDKYHGLGNDYLIYDPNKNEIELNEELIRKICHRNYGAGADGILYGPIIDGNKTKVLIYNPDGSEAEISGNGVRIFARYLLDAEYVKDYKITLTTLSGDVEVEFMDEFGQIIRVAMGKPDYWSVNIPVIGERRQVINEEMEFNNKSYSVTCLTIGNPHCIIPMEEISKDKIMEIGPFIEASKMFPKRINVQIIKVLSRNKIEIEVYERGAGYTLASGTSCCAAACAAHKLGLVDSKVTVYMPGGKLLIDICEDDMVYMTGPVKQVGSIILYPESMC